jgi:hypothetical protein
VDPHWAGIGAGREAVEALLGLDVVATMEERSYPAGSVFDDVGPGEVLVLSALMTGAAVVASANDPLATLALSTVSLALAGAGAERLWWM